MAHQQEYDNFTDFDFFFMLVNCCHFHWHPYLSWLKRHRWCNV